MVAILIDLKLPCSPASPLGGRRDALRLHDLMALHPPPVRQQVPLASLQGEALRREVRSMVRGVVRPLGAWR